MSTLGCISIIIIDVKLQPFLQRLQSWLRQRAIRDYSLNCHSCLHMGQSCWWSWELSHLRIQCMWNTWEQRPQTEKEYRYLCHVWYRVGCSPLGEVFNARFNTNLRVWFSLFSWSEIRCSFYFHISNQKGETSKMLSFTFSKATYLGGTNIWSWNS